MKNLLALALLFFAVHLIAQETKTEKTEYVTVRVQYSKSISGYRYEVFLDIGVSGAHSLSGKVTNNEKSVTISDDNGTYEFQSDMDLVNYLSKNGWKIIHTGEIDVLDQHYYTYLMERQYYK